MKPCGSFVGDEERPVIKSRRARAIVRIVYRVCTWVKRRVNESGDADAVSVKQGVPQFSTPHICIFKQEGQRVGAPQ